MVTSDNKIVIGGEFTNVGGVPRDNIARLNADDSLDTGFFGNTTFIGVTPTPAVAIFVSTLAVQMDGKVLVGGFFSSVGESDSNHIARLNVNGNIDTSFNPPALASVNSVGKLVLQPDGKILVAGFINFANGSEGSIDNLARLNSDGSLDTSFTPDASNPVNSIAIQPADDNILIGGNFTSIDNGLTRNRIARLENTVPPPEVNIATNAVVLPEGNEGQRAFNFDVSLSFSSNRPSSVQYTVSAGATQPSADANDFANAEFATGTLEFPVGAPTQTISVMVAGDTVTEEDETFTLTLSNPNNATLGASISAQGTIVDDEDDILCLPIPASNGNFAVVCL